MAAHPRPAGGGVGGDLQRAGLRIFGFGYSLRPAYGDGAAAYYRGLYKALHRLGYQIRVAAPDMVGRQQHRDRPVIEKPAFADCAVYRDKAELAQLLRQARQADLIIQHGGVGAGDDDLAQAVLETAAAAPAGARPRVAYWDVDAAATLAAVEADPRHRLRHCLPEYDYLLTAGSGPGVQRRWLQLGARRCDAVPAGVDPEIHHPAPPAAKWRSHLSFLGRRLPEVEKRVRRYFLNAAAWNPRHRFLLAGTGWAAVEHSPNVACPGGVPPGEHNALHASARFVLHLRRERPASSPPPTRVFEAAAAGAAIISDAWPGIEEFFEPGREILVAPTPQALCDYLDEVSPAAARRLGERARERALAEHRYDHRARQLDRLLHSPSTAATPACAAGAAWLAPLAAA